MSFTLMRVLNEMKAETESLKERVKLLEARLVASTDRIVKRGPGRPRKIVASVAEKIETELRP